MRIVATQRLDTKPWALDCKPLSGESAAIGVSSLWRHGDRLMAMEEAHLGREKRSALLNAPLSPAHDVGKQRLLAIDAQQSSFTRHPLLPRIDDVETAIKLGEHHWAYSDEATTADLWGEVLSVSEPLKSRRTAPRKLLGGQWLFSQDDAIEAAFVQDKRACVVAEHGSATSSLTMAASSEGAVHAVWCGSPEDEQAWPIAWALDLGALELQRERVTAAASCGATVQLLVSGRPKGVEGSKKYDYHLVTVDAAPAERHAARAQRIANDQQFNLEGLAGADDACTSFWAVHDNHYRPSGKLDGPTQVCALTPPK